MKIRKMKSITLIPLRTPIIQKGDSVAEILYKSITKRKIVVEDSDVIVIAETPVATAEGNLLKLEDVTPSFEANNLAARYEMDSRFVEIILREADEVLGGVKGVLLTIKKNILIANAGVDYSNAPLGYVSLFPKDPQKSLETIKNFLETKFKAKIALILGDSRVSPLRRGTVGVAIAVIGMDPIEDCRGKHDLFGRKLQITFRALADNLVSAAQLLMGEADEQVPAVLIKGAPIQLTDKVPQAMGISKEECLYMKSRLKDQDS